MQDVEFLLCQFPGNLKSAVQRSLFDVAHETEADRGVRGLGALGKLAIDKGEPDIVVALDAITKMVTQARGLQYDALVLVVEEKILIHGVILTVSVANVFEAVQTPQGLLVRLAQVCRLFR